MTYIKTHPSVGAAGGAFRRLARTPWRGQARASWRGLARPWHGLACALVVAVATGTAPATAQDGPQPRLPTVALTAGMHRITAEVAQTPSEKALGLMFRREMGANEGMLFVYDSPQPLCFWMRNTPLPLTIAFLDDDGRIVDLRDMQPLDERSHCASRPLRFALEMHQGWFAKRGLKPGFRIKGAPFRP